MRAALVALFVVTLPGCAERVEPDPTLAKESDGYNMINPVRVDDSETVEPPTPGAWRSASVEGARGLLFAAPGADPIFAIYCDARRGLVLERRDYSPTGTIDMMNVTIDSMSMNLAVDPVDDPVRALRAVVPYRGDLAARLQKNPAPISISVGEGAPLRLPPSPLVPTLAIFCARTR